jgi:hypothetical protein
VAETDRAAARSLNDCEFLYHVDVSVEGAHESALYDTARLAVGIIREHLPEFADRKKLKLVVCLVRVPE